MVKPNRHSARDDGDLVQRIRVRRNRRHQRVAGLVIRGILLFLVGDDHALALHAHHHFVFGQFEVELRDHLAILERAATRAASFTRFARSAPAKPGVPRAMVA